MCSTLKLSLFLVLFVYSLETSAANANGLESLLQLFQPFSKQTLPVQSPFNTSQVTQKCGEDLEHWIAALNAFLEASLVQCNQTDAECLKTQQTITGANMFAAQQIDSFGRIPPNILNMDNMWQGSWEECIAVRSPSKKDYKAKFCWQALATPITLTAAGETAFHDDMCTSTKYMNSMTQWSTCMPRSCTDQDITALFQSLNTVTEGSAKNMIMFCNNECRSPTPPKKNAGFWVVTVILSIGGLMVVFSSLVDYCTDCPKGTYKRLRSGPGMQCFLAFSMYTNGAEILSTRKIPGQIDCLHSMRVFSMTWVMLGHVLLQYMGSDNLLQVLDSNRFFLNTAFSNAFFSVDSFLFIGGLLLTFLFIKEMDRTPTKLKSGSYWFLYYLHRILRLSPPYYLFLGFTTVYFDFLTMGPTKESVMATVSGCHNSWWRNVLYINNLYDLNNMCMGHAWYLALDMQIHIFAPLFLVPLALHIIGGIASGVILIAISTGLNYWAYYKWDLPATFNGFFTHATTLDLADTAKFQQFIYFSSWVRYTPYIIGGWTGYYLYHMRKQNRKLRMHWLIAVALWICSAAIAVACVYGLYDYIKGGDLSLAARSSYYNWSRIGWSVALAWVVIACEHNLAGPAKNFLELGAWFPISRLTYCAYLVHFIMISIIFAMSRRPLHYENNTSMYISGSLPVFCLSYAVSFVWSCTFEVPSMKIERMWTAAVFGQNARGSHPRPAATAPEKPIDTAPKTNNDSWGANDMPEKKQNGFTTAITNGNADGTKLENGEARFRPAAAAQHTNAPPANIENTNETDRL